MKNLLLILFVSLLFACGSKKETIYISGSTTVLPVVSNAAEAFKKTHPNVNIIVNAGGSGVGVNQVGSGKIQFGMISRDITKAEIEKYPKCLFIINPIGIDAVVPSISSEIYNAGITALSLNQIGKIYKGEIKNWNQLGGPDKEIYCVDKEKSRGTRHVFMKSVFGNKEEEAPGADAVSGSNNEEQTILTQSDAAIGMLSHAWLNDEVKGLSIVLKDSSVVAPTLANIVNGSFPITRDLTVISNGTPLGLEKEFLDYLLSPEGQQFVKDAGYVSIN
jgi:phosphate transport system substrate-binding protein